MTGYLYYSNGRAIIEQHYSGPGRFTFEQAEAQIDSALNVGSVVTIHMGHGQYHQFECIAIDDTHALLQGCAH